MFHPSIKLCNLLYTHPIIELSQRKWKIDSLYNVCCWWWTNSNKNKKSWERFSFPHSLVLVRFKIASRSHAPRIRKAIIAKLLWCFESRLSDYVIEFRKQMYDNESLENGNCCWLFIITFIHDEQLTWMRGN